MEAIERRLLIRVKYYVAVADILGIFMQAAPSPSLRNTVSGPMINR